ncbi:MBL fold metallo-hydrolase [Secundilactobacillus hailunensis]|uniref:MBL fold metallo-hydrolase n=1 Tax=Secundilactobacillus hailunensis TaxID=2559923 RepID=A0ABW1T7Q2_9LACO|nr:MBL fold metallo-hydrolase [Secundilactobacillus hailunensis]
MVKQQVPGYFRYTLGDYEITALYDGFACANSDAYFGSDPETVEKIWQTNYTNTTVIDGRTNIKAASNTYLVDTGKELYLIDTGSGKALGPTMGKLLTNLKASGYQPEDVDKIMLTHAHPDHIDGLTIDNQMIFPNATVYLKQSDYDLWVNILPNLKDLLAPYQKKNQCVLFNDGDPIADGITAVPLPGHSIGHTGYQIESAGHKLFAWGDIIHDADVQLNNLGVEVVMGKMDEKRIAIEIATAKKTVEQVANTQELVAGAHLPFPGIGHIVKNTATTGYRFIPVHYNEVN